MAAVVPKMCLQQCDAQVSDDTVRYQSSLVSKAGVARGQHHIHIVTRPILYIVVSPLGKRFRPSTPFHGVAFANITEQSESNLQCRDAWLRTLRNQSPINYNSVTITYEKDSLHK